MMIVIVIVIIVNITAGRTSDHYETSGSSVTSSINSANHTDRSRLMHHSHIWEIFVANILGEL